MQSIDRVLVRKLLQLPRSSSISGMYLEMGLLEVRHIIRGRRLTFLHYILGRSESDLVYQVYNAQKESTTKGDWYEVIQDDLKSSELDQYNEAQIKAFSKQQWKYIVKKAITEQAFQELTLEAKGKTKTKELKYKTLDIKNISRRIKLSLKQS